MNFLSNGWVTFELADDGTGGTIVILTIRQRCCHGWIVGVNPAYEQNPAYCFVECIEGEKKGNVRELFTIPGPYRINWVF